MIISASRRTDIPALYSEWFMNRARAGYCAVPNPMNPKQVARVSLLPDDVDAMVFWSKNPAPLIPRLNELEALGLTRYYFQFTLNDYPQELEPGIPSSQQRVETFRRLSQRLGDPRRTIWRYDPIILSNYTPATWHEERFGRLAGELAGHTRRVVISLLDTGYRKVQRQLDRLGAERQYEFDEHTPESDAVRQLLATLSSVAQGHHLEIVTCAEPAIFAALGIGVGHCVDAELINQLWGRSGGYQKDPNQRKACGCATSKDIGMNDSCTHGCPYCYSTRSLEAAKRNQGAHDPQAESLWGGFQAPAEGPPRLF